METKEEELLKDGKYNEEVKRQMEGAEGHGEEKTVRIRRWKRRRRRKTKRERDNRLLFETLQREEGRGRMTDVIERCKSMKQKEGKTRGQ